MLEEGFGPLGLDRIVAITREANHRSRHVLGKLSFRLDGTRHVWGAEQLYFVSEREHPRVGAHGPAPPPHHRNDPRSFSCGPATAPPRSSSAIRASS